MFDVQKNNWLLDKTIPAPNYAAQVVLDMQIELTEPPVFNYLQRDGWTHIFYKKHFKTLARMARQLGLPACEHRSEYVLVLTSYFQRLVA